VLEILNRAADALVNIKESDPMSTEAEIDPVDVLDKFNPTIPDAGILASPAPDPSKDPEVIPELLTVSKVVPASSNMNAFTPVDTEAVTAPDFI
jgi:hypothetical protein